MSATPVPYSLDKNNDTFAVFDGEVKGPARILEVNWSVEDDSTPGWVFMDWGNGTTSRPFHVSRMCTIKWPHDQEISANCTAKPCATEGVKVKTFITYRIPKPLNED